MISQYEINMKAYLVMLAHFTVTIMKFNYTNIMYIVYIYLSMRKLCFCLKDAVSYSFITFFVCAIQLGSLAILYIFAYLYKHIRTYVFSQKFVHSN